MPIKFWCPVRGHLESMLGAASEFLLDLKEMQQKKNDQRGKKEMKEENG